MKSWRVLNKTSVISVEPWFQISREEVELPSGRIVSDFYRVVMPEFAMVVPVTDSGELVTVRGYRHGPRKICLGVPGGLIESHETPLAAAQRELLEETGYRASEWKSLGTFTVDSNRQGGTAHFFLARKLHQVEQRLDDDAEDLRIEVMKPDQFLDSIASEEISTLAAVSAIALALAHGLK
jgi:ADP-ribose pyrophosphatase